MAWRLRRKPSNLISISDPVLAEYFGVGIPNYSGELVTETRALTVSAFYRGVALVSGAIGGLPLRVLRDVEGVRTRVSSFLDAPDGPFGLTEFEWKETLAAHLLTNGNAFLRHVFNGAGSLAQVKLVHPGAVEVRWADVWPDGREVVGGKIFKAHLADNTFREYDATGMTQVMNLSLDGLRGLSVVGMARNSLGTALAGERAAAKMFNSGALISGMVTSEDDLEEDDAKKIRESLDATITGTENAGRIAVINRRLKFSPWTMSLEDAQFLQSRAFQIEEIARWFGIPPHLLAQTEKQTSWGTGVAEQNRGLSRFTLKPWTDRIEARLSRLLPAPRFCEFDYAGFIKPSPEVEIELLIKQVEAGVITVNEYRHIRNMDPIEGGDVLRGQSASTPEAVPA